MKVTARKKGNKRYFYLKHSFRKDGRIITKEKYLGTEIPSDIEDVKSKFEVQTTLSQRTPDLSTVLNP